MNSPVLLSQDTNQELLLGWERSWTLCGEQTSKRSCISTQVCKGNSLLRPRASRSCCPCFNGCGDSRSWIWGQLRWETQGRSWERCGADLLSWEGLDFGANPPSCGGERFGGGKCKKNTGKAGERLWHWWEVHGQLKGDWWAGYWSGHLRMRLILENSSLCGVAASSCWFRKVNLLSIIL